MLTLILFLSLLPATDDVVIEVERVWTIGTYMKTGIKIQFTNPTDQPITVDPTSLVAFMKEDEQVDLTDPPRQFFMGQEATFGDELKPFRLMPNKSKELQFVFEKRLKTPFSIHFGASKVFEKE